VEYGPTEGYIAGEASNDAALTMVVPDILNKVAGAMDMGDELYRGKEGEFRLKGGLQLDIVADVMESFVSERAVEVNEKVQDLQRKIEMAAKEEEGRKEVLEEPPKADVRWKSSGQDVKDKET
jgi:hypothetical protein